MELLLEDGLEGFSMNRLARACGISVATLYIYYKDKDDLIKNVAIEEGKKMADEMLKDFDPYVSFEEGLRQQWKNRAKYMLENTRVMLFFEQLRSSTYQDTIFETVMAQFKETMGIFMKNAIANGEVAQMPLEVYWSVAFAPLYNLLRFHHEGRSIGNKSFVLKDKMIWQTFDLVVRALKP